MARGTTLTNLLAMLKAELRDAQETNSPIDTEYGYALSNMQKFLASEYDWNFLKHDWDLSCAVGSRYLSIPTTDTRAVSATINFERPVEVSRLYSNTYEPVKYGIGINEYNIREGTSERQDPIMRWQVVSNINETSNADQIEIWPSPNTAQTLRFTGQRALKTLSSASDTADLDDLLLVLFVSAKYKRLREAGDADDTVKQANQRLIKLRASYPINEEPVQFSRLTALGKQKIKLVAVA